MSSQIKCSICGNTATVHLTQIVNNKMHKVDLCQTCADTKGVTDPSGFSLVDLLAKVAQTHDADEEGALTCKTCGFSQKEFKKIGRFGCPECYQAFNSLLSPMLPTMHRGTHHIGKVPQKLAQRRSIYERITQLENELDTAIKAERYEDAARYRDEIRQIKEAT